jgi:hypothetical protein
VKDEDLELYAGAFADWPGNVDEVLDERGLRNQLLTVNVPHYIGSFAPGLLDRQAVEDAWHPSGDSPAISTVRRRRQRSWSSIRPTSGSRPDD